MPSSALIAEGAVRIKANKIRIIFFMLLRFEFSYKNTEFLNVLMGYEVLKPCYFLKIRV